MDRKFCLDMAAAYTSLANREFPVAAPAPPPPAPTPMPPVPAFTPGTRPFAAASPFNTPTPANTQWFDHQLLHVSSKGNPMQWYPGIGGDPITWYGSATDPVWTVTMGWGPSGTAGYVDLARSRNNPPFTESWHLPANLAIGQGFDKILCIVDTTTGNYLDVWNAIVDPVTHTVKTGNPNFNGGQGGWGRGNIVTGNGAGRLDTNDGVRASNFSWIAGCITGHDLASGIIDHALAVAAPNWLGKASNWIAPATCGDADWPGPMAMGTKIGIPAATPTPAGLSATGIAVFNALRKYGAYLGDFAGGEWPVVYTDANTVTVANGAPLQNWNGGIWDAICPLLRIANYQP
jgi:hypothetical protein